MNAGLLPDGYYAQAEQVAGDVTPDVLTFQDMGGAAVCDAEVARADIGGAAGLAVADLTREMYVNVPLEETYMAADDGVPQRWKRVIEGA